MFIAYASKNFQGNCKPSKDSAVIYAVIYHRMNKNNKMFDHDDHFYHFYHVDHFYYVI